VSRSSGPNVRMALHSWTAVADGFTVAKKAISVDVFESADAGVLRPGEQVLAVGTTKSKSLFNGLAQNALSGVAAFVIAYLFGLIGILVFVGILSLVDRKVNPRPAKGTLASLWPRQQRLVALATQRVVFAKDRGDRPVKDVVYEFERSAIQSIRETTWKNHDALAVVFADGSTLETLGDARTLAAQFPVGAPASGSTLPPPPPMPLGNAG